MSFATDILKYYVMDDGIDYFMLKNVSKSFNCLEMWADFDDIESRLKDDIKSKGGQYYHYKMKPRAASQARKFKNDFGLGVGDIVLARMRGFNNSDFHHLWFHKKLDKVNKRREQHVKGVPYSETIRKLGLQSACVKPPKDDYFKELDNNMPLNKPYGS